MIGLRSRYGLLGLALIMGGALFALAAWLLLDYMPLVALGVATVTLGTVSLALGRSLPRVSPDASLIFLEAGYANLAALVEELGLRSRALYLPSSLTEGGVRALIPLRGNSIHLKIQRRLEQRLIVRFGPGPEDVGILVATPAPAAFQGWDSPTDTSGELEAALSSVLVASLDLVEGVRVGPIGKRLVVEVARPAVPRRNHPVSTVLGSPAASLVATLTAQALDRPLSVVEETERGRWLVIELEVQEGEEA
ncbi:MAG: hypothetical protein ACE5I2_09820 [Anaerolineae bacterium]